MNYEDNVKEVLKTFLLKEYNAIDDKALVELLSNQSDKVKLIRDHLPTIGLIWVPKIESVIYSLLNDLNITSYTLEGDVMKDPYKTKE